ncbi:hypothetical protein MOA67_gp332 [Klebsiella phage KpLz-2_45]|uniref:hypothetical protein n=1 Tax=Klebsiella phage KpLz-2_45 TaxID=2698923 RepID=UPI001F139A32|nr:hypothetical protein MOA67_gp332 [Klebsiella phage KpLz-2_45]UKS72091.1 hypothetical protein KpLz245_2250 [Klebsiella phage KpLz-2_45]
MTRPKLIKSVETITERFKETFVQINDSSEIYRLCLEHELYLYKGKMLEALYDQRQGEIPCRAIFYREDAVVVLIPGERGNKRVWEGMLYVRSSYRGTGLAVELVKAIMPEAEDKEVYWHPWDLQSCGFFTKLKREGILNETHFDDKARAMFKAANLVRRC